MGDDEATRFGAVGWVLIAALALAVTVPWGILAWVESQAQATVRVHAATIQAAWVALDNGSMEALVRSRCRASIFDSKGLTILSLDEAVRRSVHYCWDRTPPSMRGDQIRAVPQRVRLPGRATQTVPLSDLDRAWFRALHREGLAPMTIPMPAKGR